MQLRLREGLSYGLCSGRIVLLDAPADRYLCVPAVYRDTFLSLCRDSSVAQRKPGLDHLVDMGLLRFCEGEAAFPPPASIEPARHDLAEASDGRSRRQDVMRALAAETCAMVELRCRRLDRILDGMEGAGARPDSGLAEDDSRLLSIAGAFARTSLVFPVADRCLVRAMALMRLCHRRGLRPRLVLGVRLDPFAAHCWVQNGDAVVIGGLEQARHFTPVRVVG